MYVQEPIVSFRSQLLVSVSPFYLLFVMSWRARYQGYSSLEGATKFRHRLKDERNQMPAENAEEALWRVSKRISSAYRWLCVDLTLLAKQSEHQAVLSSVEFALKAIGEAVLPDLGKNPTVAKSKHNANFMELVGVLSQMRDSVPVHKTVPEAPKTAGVTSRSSRRQKTKATHIESSSASS